MFLTMLFALSTMIASAQFVALTTLNKVEGADPNMIYEGDDCPDTEDSWNITDNMGIVYILNDKMTVGIVKNGEDYDLWGRYNINSMYVVVQAPTDSITDAANIGVGYSLNVWDKLYLEPSYSMPMKENSGGTFKVGVAYRF